MPRQIRWVHVVKLQEVGKRDQIIGIYPRKPDALEVAKHVADRYGPWDAGSDGPTMWMRVGVINGAGVFVTPMRFNEKKYWR